MARAGPRARSAPDPDQLGLVTSIGGRSDALAMFGGVAVVGLGARIAAVDVGDPRRATAVVSSDVLPGLACEVAVSGDRAYVSAGSAGVLVKSARSPWGWRQRSHEGLATDARGVAPVGSRGWDVLPCWLGPLLVRVTEATCEEAWWRVRMETRRLRRAVEGPAGPFSQRTRTIKLQRRGVAPLGGAFEARLPLCRSVPPTASRTRSRDCRLPRDILP